MDPTNRDISGLHCTWKDVLCFEINLRWWCEIMLGRYMYVSLLPAFQLLMSWPVLRNRNKWKNIFIFFENNTVYKGLKRLSFITVPLQIRQGFNLEMAPNCVMFHVWWGWFCILFLLASIYCDTGHVESGKRNLSYSLYRSVEIRGLSQYKNVVLPIWGSPC